MNITKRNLMKFIKESKESPCNDYEEKDYQEYAKGESEWDNGYNACLDALEDAFDLENTGR